MICGYIGETYDIVLYIARTLTKLNRKTLIIDLSETEHIYEAIKHGMELDSKTGIINYREINYTRKIPENEEIKEYEDGFILVVFGENYCNIEHRINLDKIYLSVSILPSTTKKAKETLQKITTKDTNILIRDVITIDDVERVKEELNINDSQKLYYLYYNAEDFDNFLQCQLRKIIKFKNISARNKRYIEKTIQELNPEINKKQIKKAIRGV